MRVGFWASTKGVKNTKSPRGVWRIWQMLVFLKMQHTQNKTKQTYTLKVCIKSDLEFFLLACSMLNPDPINRRKNFKKKKKNATFCQWQISEPYNFLFAIKMIPTWNFDTITLGVLDVKSVPLESLQWNWHPCGRGRSDPRTLCSVQVLKLWGLGQQIHSGTRENALVQSARWKNQPCAASREPAAEWDLRGPPLWGGIILFDSRLHLRAGADAHGS